MSHLFLIILTIWSQEGGLWTQILKEYKVNKCLVRSKIIRTTYKTCTEERDFKFYLKVNLSPKKMYIKFEQYVLTIS